MVEELGVVGVGEETAMGKERGEVVREDEKEDGPSDGTLDYTSGEGEGRGRAYGLNTTTEVAGKPLGLNAVPAKFFQEEAMIHAVESFTKIERRQRRNVTSVDLI